jgi:hypothetical protein
MTKSTDKIEEKPDRKFFSIPRVEVRKDKVLVTQAVGDKPAVYEERPIYTSQDEAVKLAEAQAKKDGYAKISLQNQTDTEWRFLAYEPEGK